MLATLIAAGRSRRRHPNFGEDQGLFACSGGRSRRRMPSGLSHVVPRRAGLASSSGQPAFIPPESAKLQALAQLTARWCGGPRPRRRRRPIDHDGTIIVAQARRAVAHEGRAGTSRWSPSGRKSTWSSPTSFATATSRAAKTRCVRPARIRPAADGDHALLAGTPPTTATRCSSTWWARTSASPQRRQERARSSRGSARVSRRAWQELETRERERVDLARWSSIVCGPRMPTLRHRPAVHPCRRDCSWASRSGFTRW